MRRKRGRMRTKTRKKEKDMGKEERAAHFEETPKQFTSSLISRYTRNHTPKCPARGSRDYPLHPWPVRILLPSKLNLVCGIGARGRAVADELEDRGP